MGVSPVSFPTARPAVPLTAADSVYGAGAALVFGLARLAARAIGVSVHERMQRAGHLPQPAAPVIWFHGASAGELATAVTLASLLRKAGCRFTAAYTAANRAGVEYAARAIDAGDRTSGEEPDLVAFAPWDAPRWIVRAFDTWRPRALFLLETELWPRLIFEAHRRKIPVFCASARIYPRDVRRYRAGRVVISPTVRRLTAILAQDAVEHARFVDLGADPNRCLITGNLKYVALRSSSPPGRGQVRGSKPPHPISAAPADATPPPAAAESERSYPLTWPLPEGEDFRADLRLADADQVVVCGSIHADEVGFVFAAFDRLRSAPRLIIAPRRPAVGDAVVRAARDRGWMVHRRTAGIPPRAWRVLVLDTVGELRRVYAMACVAVVGGGFGTHGGHNLIEPLVAGVPVLFGSHYHHFADLAAAIAAATPAAQVASAADLSRVIAAWLNDAALRACVVTLQRAALPDASAIAKRYLNVLSPWLQQWNVGLS